MVAQLHSSFEPIDLGDIRDEVELDREIEGYRYLVRRVCESMATRDAPVHECLRRIGAVAVRGRWFDCADNTFYYPNAPTGDAATLFNGPRLNTDAYEDPLDARPFSWGGHTALIAATYWLDPDNPIREFQRGIGGDAPSIEVVNAANNLNCLANLRTVQPEISVDGDGALSLDLRLRDGALVMAEMEMDGTVNAGVYDGNNEEIRRISSGRASDLAQLIIG